MVELDLGNTSFYDFGSIAPKSSDRPGSEGPVKDVPGRVQGTPFDMTFLKQTIASKPGVRQAPENDPRSWNMGGNGKWWSVFEELGTDGKKPIND